MAKSVFTKIEGGFGLQVEVMISAEDIAKRVRELSEESTRDYDSKDSVVVGILKAVVFMSDPHLRITVPLEVDFMATSSYGLSTQTSGVVQLLKDLDTLHRGPGRSHSGRHHRHGLTLSYLNQLLHSHKPASIKTAVLLDKPDRRQTEFVPDYVGFVIRIDS